MFTRITLASVIAFALIFGASQPAAAQSVDAQIQSLMERIQELTRKLNDLRNSSSMPSWVAPATPATTPALKHRICSILYRNLSQGVSGSDVQSLQEFLQEQGYLSAQPTGFFGPLTIAAVKKWQAAQGVEAAGSFGPLSRERLRIWCGGIGVTPENRLFSASPKQGTAPLTVTFSSMVGGFRPAGISYVIDFGDGTTEPAQECSAPADTCVSPGTNRHIYAQNGTYTARLLKKERNTCESNSSTACAAWYEKEEVVGTATITVGSSVSCTEEYAPVCGAKPVVCITTPCNPVPTTYSNLCAMRADGATFLYGSSCRATEDPAKDPQCKTWYDGCNTCSRSVPGGDAACTLKACFVQGIPYCTARFNDTSTNRPPTVSGISGPTTLSVNQSGTWTVNASDPENGPLSYSVNWGDTASYGFSETAATSLPVQNTSTFTHSYAQAGTYTIKVTITDNKGASTQTSTTVVVTGSVTACTMEYAPVCGRPAGCANTCAPGQVCPAICQLHTPQTYGNRCAMNNANATFLHTGECTSTSGNWY